MFILGRLLSVSGFVSGFTALNSIVNHGRERIRYVAVLRELAESVIRDCDVPVVGVVLLQEPQPSENAMASNPEIASELAPELVLACKPI